MKTKKNLKNPSKREKIEKRGKIIDLHFSCFNPFDMLCERFILAQYFSWPCSQARNSLRDVYNPKKIEFNEFNVCQNKKG